MIQAIVHCRLFTHPHLHTRGGRMFAAVFARCREPDGAVQVLKLWTSAAAMRETLMQLRAGAAVVVAGALVGEAVTPVGGAEKKPLLCLHVQSIEAERAASTPVWPYDWRGRGRVVKFPGSPRGAAEGVP